MKYILSSLLIFSLIGLSSSIIAKSKHNPALCIGDTAPDFTLPDQNNKKVSFYAIKGKKVLYFYPMDNTPGCTKEACSLRDGYKDLQKAGITIIGISYDSPKSHKHFIEKHHLPFMLLSDEHKDVAKLYHAQGWFFLRWLFPSRISYLIDENNTIVDIIKDVKVKDHADQIIEAFNCSKKRTRS